LSKENVGASQSHGLPRPVTGTALPIFTIGTNISVSESSLKTEECYTPQSSELFETSDFQPEEHILPAKGVPEGRAQAMKPTLLLTNQLENFFLTVFTYASRKHHSQHLIQALKKKLRGF
jgi:hypothetical protein